MTLAEIEKAIGDCMMDDTQRWTVMARYLMTVDEQQLYKPDYTSLSAWMNHLAETLNCTMSLLWQRLKAGRYYDGYASRSGSIGMSVPALEKAQISSETLILAQKVAGSDNEEADKLIEKAIAGEIGKKDLAAAWKARKEAGGYVRKSRFDKEADSIDATEVTEAVLSTALDARFWLDEFCLETNNGVLQSNKSNRWSGDRMPRYRRIPQFTVPGSGVSRWHGMDDLVIETYSVKDSSSVRMHAIEIKTSCADLQADEEMGDYAPYADCMWLYVPIAIEQDALDYAAPNWGVIVYNDEKEARMSRAAQIAAGAQRGATALRVVRYIL